MTTRRENARAGARASSTARQAAALATALLLAPTAGFAQPGTPTPRVTAALASAASLNAAPAPGTLRSFVSCPIVRDTSTVPCWLAEHAGELYYLGIQTDISADFDPPYLGHRVLVEGVVKDAARICGGIVLEPVSASPLPELDATCNTILPAEARYEVPFAPRPPGPSGGRLAFDPAPGAARAAPRALEGPQEFVLEHDFDVTVMGRHSAALTRAFDYAHKSGAQRISIVGRRGASLLSNGTTLTERSDIAELRAREVAGLLQRAGVDAAALDVTWSSDVQAPDGDGDWHSRRTVIHVEP